MKKLIALILCVSMLTGMLPAASLADTLLYEYPQVNAYLSSNDREALEYEFRQWAAKVITEYYNEYEMRENQREKLANFGQGTVEQAIEYCRLANTKVYYDDSRKGTLEENIYNTRTMSESEVEGFYLWVFLESLKENMALNSKAITQQYNSIDKDDHRYWMLDTETGTLKYDSIAEQAQNASDDVMNSRWFTALSDCVTATINTVGNYFIVTNGANDILSDVLDIALDVVDSAMEQWIAALRENALIEVDNNVREELKNRLQEAVLTTSDAMIEYLKETYFNIPFDAERSYYSISNMLGSEITADYLGMIRAFVNKVEANKSKYENDLKKEVGKEVESDDVDSIMTALGYDVVEFLQGPEILAMVLFDMLKTVITDAVDFGIKKLNGVITEKGAKQGRVTFAGKLYLFDWQTLIEGCKDLIVTPMESAVDAYLAQILVDARNGKEFPEHMWSDVGEKIRGAVVKEFNDNFLEKIIAALVSHSLGAIISGLMDSEATEVKKLVIKAIDDELFSVFDDLLEDGTLDGFDEDGFDKDYINDNVEPFVKKMFKLFGKIYKENTGGAEKLKKTRDETENLLNIESNSSSPNKNKMEEFSNEIDKLDKQIEANQIFTIIGNVWDDWWETGSSIRNALESTTAATHAEGIMSMLAARMVTCRNMRRPVYSELIRIVNGKFRSAVVAGGKLEIDEEMILDPEQTTLEELNRVVSIIYMENKYNIIGSCAYFNMVLHEDVFRGESFWPAAFMDYITKNHINMFGQKGLISYDDAAGEYNHYVDLGKMYEMDDKWRVLFQ